MRHTGLSTLPMPAETQRIEHGKRHNTPRVLVGKRLREALQQDDDEQVQEDEHDQEREGDPVEVWPAQLGSSTAAHTHSSFHETGPRRNTTGMPQWPGSQSGYWMAHSCISTFHDSPVRERKRDQRACAPARSAWRTLDRSAGQHTHPQHVLEVRVSRQHSLIPDGAEQHDASHGVGVEQETEESGDVQAGRNGSTARRRRQ